MNPITIALRLVTTVADQVQDLIKVVDQERNSG